MAGRSSRGFVWPETAVRVRLRLSYKRSNWGSVQLEMAPVEGKMGRELDRVKAMSLDPLQVPLPGVANCVSLRQIAQKLHACTEVFNEGRENDPFNRELSVVFSRELHADGKVCRYPVESYAPTAQEPRAALQAPERARRLWRSTLP